MIGKIQRFLFSTRVIAGLALTLTLGMAALNSTAAQPLAQSSAQPTSPALPTELPHLRIDLENRYVDLDATVVLREADWLELVACSPGSREHESILTIEARASHIHLALVMLGLEPGAPLSWHVDPANESVITAPHGPVVIVTAILPNDPDQIQTPIHHWVKHQPTGQTLPDSRWLFVGSQFRTLGDQRVYAADITGSILSLVNFGDDVLTRPTDTTHRDDNAMWGAMTDAIPPVGTQVILRLRPVDEAKEESRPRQ